MNKETPPDDCTKTFEEFEQYMKSEIIEHDGQKTEVLYVPSEHMHKIVFAVFVGQKDVVRIDAAELLNKF